MLDGLEQYRTRIEVQDDPRFRHFKLVPLSNFRDVVAEAGQARYFTDMRGRVALLGLLFINFMEWPALAWAPATPLFELHIRADKPAYLLGEPVRLTASLRNLSSVALVLDRLPVFCAITPPRGAIDFRAGFDGEVPATELAPGDSVLFFLYPNAAGQEVTPDGSFVAWRRDSDIFAQLGDYRFRAYCRPRSHAKSTCANWSGPITASNYIELSINTPRRSEARVIDVLRQSRVVGDRYLSGDFERRDDHFGVNDSDLERLRVVKSRVPHSPLIAYVDYAIARMLLDNSVNYLDESGDYLREQPVRVHESIVSLESLHEDHPEFRPEEVLYYLAMALVRSDVCGRWFGDRTRANRMISALLQSQPDLKSNLDFAMLAQTASQTYDDIEVCLDMDRREYLVGEPLLFRVMLVNRSNRIVRVPSGPIWTPFEAGFVGCLEVEGPDGKRYLRTSNRPTGGGPGPAYVGLPLAPGDSLVSIWDHTAANMPVDGRGYVPLNLKKRALGNAGIHRIRAGFSPDEAQWRVWGAGRLTFSGPVEIVLREPNESEKRTIDALREARIDNAFGIDRDGKAIRTLTDALQAGPAIELSYHLQRGLAWAYSCSGPNQDLERSLSILEALEPNTTDLRKQWVQLNKLKVIARLWEERQLSETHRAAVLQLIANLEQENPTIWTDTAFCFYAFRALHGKESWRWTYCWEATIHRSGFRSESPLDLNVSAP